MREHNAALEHFVVTTDAPMATLLQNGNHIAAVLTATPKEIKRRVQADANEALQQRKTAREALSSLSS